MIKNTCICGRDKYYEECCGAIHRDIRQAITAEDLMRSRFTAFTLAKGDFLMKSQHSETRVLADQKNIENWAKTVQWLKLDILMVSEGQSLDENGVVEFKAFFIDEGNLDEIHETSTFKKENGHWVYYNALQTD